jgi:hypothetical protein
MINIKRATWIKWVDELHDIWFHIQFFALVVLRCVIIETFIHRVSIVVVWNKISDRHLSVFIDDDLLHPLDTLDHVSTLRVFQSNELSSTLKVHIGWSLLNTTRVKELDGTVVVMLMVLYHTLSTYT